MIPWALIPTAGRGTRLHPASLAVPKVLLPIGMLPMLHWTLQEAMASGVQAIAVVVASGPSPVRDYVEAAVRSAGNADELGRLGHALEAVELRFVEQPRPEGIADAMLRCRGLTGDDAFAVLPPDNWFDTEVPAIAQVAETFEATGDCSIGLSRVTAATAALFGDVGRVELEPLGGRSYRIRKLQDKGRGRFHLGKAASMLRGCARYVLDPSFYGALTATGPPVEGEWDDVPAFQRLAGEGRLAGHRLQGTHFDVGHRAGYLAACAYTAEKQQEADVTRDSVAP